jgi:hypothetical protein
MQKVYFGRLGATSASRFIVHANRNPRSWSHKSSLGSTAFQGLSGLGNKVLAEDEPWGPKLPRDQKVADVTRNQFKAVEKRHRDEK